MCNFIFKCCGYSKFSETIPSFMKLGVKREDTRLPGRSFQNFDGIKYCCKKKKKKLVYYIKEIEKRRKNTCEL